MTIQFDFKMISHYGFKRYRKAKLLAKAIKKANEWHDEWNTLDERNAQNERTRHWLEVAEKLSADSRVPTEYVPVHMMMKSLHNGYVNLVLNLYGQPELVPTKEMQKRTTDLFLDLFLLHRGRPRDLDIIEKAYHFIEVIKAIYIIRFANLEDVSGKLATEYLKYQSLNNKIWDNYDSKIIARVIEQTVQMEFDIPESINGRLANLMRLIPVQNIGIRYETGCTPHINIKALFIKKYPFDYLRDQYDLDIRLDIRKILGMEQDFSYSQSVRSPILTRRPLKFHQIKYVHRKILEFKTKGIDPNVVAIKLQIKGIYLRGEDILEIYNVISEDGPEPDVLFGRSTRNLKLSQELLQDIESTSPKSVSKNSLNSSGSNFPKSDFSDDNQDICLKGKGGLELKNDSLKLQDKSIDNNFSTTNKSFIEIRDIDKSNIEHTDSQMGNTTSIKIDPMDEVGEVIYCDAARKVDHSSSILGSDDDISEEFL